MSILLAAMLLGLIVAAIAHSKGRNFFLWWLYGSAIWIVAIVHVILIKPNQASLDRRALKGGETKRCEDCAELVNAQAKVCKHCGKVFGAPTVEAAAPAVATDHQIVS